MSDPLSVAGTAVGITSLGIQVCQGLISYLRAVRGRKEEIRDGVREVEQVVSLLYSLNNTLSSVGLRNGTTSLRKSIKNCYARLEELRKLLDELGESRFSNKAMKGIAVMRAMSYPFQQEKLSRIRESLRSVLSDLGLIISVISLDINAFAHDAVNDISRDLKDHTTTHQAHLVDVQTQVHCNSVQLRSLQTAISDTLNDIQEQLHETQLRVQDLDQRIDGKLTIVEAGTRSIEANTQVTAAKLEKVFQALEVQSALMSSMALQIDGAQCFQYTGAATTNQTTDAPETCRDISSVGGFNIRLGQDCYCATALPKSTAFFTFWKLEFIFEEQEYHLQSCKLWGTRKGTKRKTRADFRLKLAWLSARIFHTCFEYTSGTSGPSLSIRCKNTVRQENSPVRKAMYNFCGGKSVALGTLRQMTLDLELLEREILTLYSKGLASPLDTDEYGYTHAEMLLFRRILQNETLTYKFLSCIRALLQAMDFDSEVIYIAEYLVGLGNVAKSEQEVTNMRHRRAKAFSTSGINNKGW
ncbi:hypothetical protein FSPOR_11641 [Fusarium sporotrichioides]|uniref:Azaphilone pigments biosynthesis cluster protein L N-terminal domain-containing protein n=1 Tax=Fusarium sporotrichioides TaxID=5514 RepID=A0A395RGD3_FUSSP|nr:hypothetical protein FSPOR_11641 [Fusarium sporotrichioides]